MGSMNKKQRKQIMVQRKEEAQHLRDQIVGPGAPPLKFHRITAAEIGRGVRMVAEPDK